MRTYKVVFLAFGIILFLFTYAEPASRSYITYKGKKFSVVATPEEFVKCSKRKERVAIAFKDTEMKSLFKAIIGESEKQGIKAPDILEPANWINAEIEDSMPESFVMRQYNEQTGQKRHMIMLDGDEFAPQSSDGYYYFIYKGPYVEAEKQPSVTPKIRELQNRVQLTDYLESQRYYFLAYYYEGKDNSEQGYKKMVSQITKNNPSFPILIEQYQVPQERQWMSDYLVLLSFDRHNLNDVTGKLLDHLKIPMGEQNSEHFSGSQGADMRDRFKYLKGILVKRAE
ncbi:MAG: hypothetical protein JXA79_12865 [Deltaproteobacteria bacterium]|nr:hypothetical protein [Deltaproteobacteria bacterium]